MLDIYFNKIRVNWYAISIIITEPEIELGLTFWLTNRPEGIWPRQTNQT